MIVARYVNSGDPSYVLMWDTTPGAFKILIADDSLNLIQRSSATVPAKNTWYHVVAVYNASAQTLDIFVNGVIDNGTLSGIVPSSQRSNGAHLVIGKSPNNFSRFKGLIDDVRIYNRALSPDEIKRLYNLGGTVKLNSSQNLNNNNSLQKGLVGWWTFDGKDMAGVHAYDKSGNDNRGILTSGPTRTIGKIGQGLQFDGSNDYVDANNSTSLQSPTTAITMTGWVTQDGPPSSDYAWIFGKIQNVGSGQGNFIRQNAGNRGQLEAYIYTGSMNGTAVSNAISLGKWYFVAMYWSSGSPLALDIYNSDGTLFQHVEIASAVSGTLQYSTDDFQMGANENLGSFWKGRVDDVRIYNRALSRDEIKRLYNIGGTVKLNTSQNLNNNNSLQKGLVGWWTFDGKDLSGVQAYDRSGNGNRGILNNGPVRTVGKLGQALQFDGSNDYVLANSSLGITGEPLTMCAWFNSNNLGPDGFSSWIVTMKLDDGVDFNQRRYLEIDINGSISAYSKAGSGTDQGASISGVVQKKIWYHGCGVYETTSLRKVYLDGTLRATNTGTVSPSAPTLARIGFGIPDGNEGMFSGVIDDVRIYNRALSADEIKRLYNMGR